jgi:dynein heavy chain
LKKINSELKNLSLLYKLYSSVLDTLNDWKERLWTEIDVDMIDEWMELIDKYKK